jgi:hypothetical protein
LQIRCSHCTKTIALAEGGALPVACPHCTRAPGPGALGPYEPIRLLAAGGMGEVYLARHRELGTEVALKVLPAMPLDAAAAVRERFAREARLTAKADYPGIVRVLGHDVAHDRPYLVLEHVAGHTLRERLRGGPLPVAEAARIAADVADVLAAAHAHGVLHRDVKPDNVMVQPDGAVRVLDFGVARAVQDDAPLTRTGEIVGTPEYMAPEQLLEGPDAIDARTDVHALGVLLHELLTGRSPFRGSNVFQALKLVESLAPPPPSSLRPAVPAALDAVVARALQKTPGERHPTAAAFAADVRTALPAAAAPPRGGVARRLALLAAALLALVAATIAVTLAAIDRLVPRALTAIAGVVPQAAQQAVGNAVDDATAGLWIHEGHWHRTLAAAVAADHAASNALHERAREAFVLAQTGWTLAAGAPPWLALSAQRSRARWFRGGEEPGSGGVPVEPALDLADAAASVARGANGPNDEPTRTELRLRLLASHRDGGDAGALLAQHRDGRLADDALARLLRTRLLPRPERIDALDAYGRRLPLEMPEHWLARTIERHLRGDAAGATEAAELAWLNGAGELAVLLDAWLCIAAPDGAGGALRALPADAAARLRARVAAGDRDDAPALVPMLALLDAVHGAPIDCASLRTCAPPLRDAAARWFVAAAAAARAPAPALLLAAVALGAVPDHAAPPWSLQPGPVRAAIDAEVQRGR